MKEIEVGDVLRVHSYKHNGKIHQASDEATVLYIDNEMLICGNNRTMLTENDGRRYKTKEPAILIFYKNHWFNIIGQIKKHGLFYYCNISSPYLIDEDVIKYIDYDLDLRVFPDGGFKVLDRNEYRYNKERMQYGVGLEGIIQSELSELIELKRKDSGPFVPGLIYEYYEKYKNLKKE